MVSKLSNIEHCKKIQRQINKMNNKDNILQILKSIEISYLDIKKTYLELFVAHPGLETIDEAESLFELEFQFAINDPNLCLLVYSGILLEKEGKNNKLPFISKEDYDQDLSYLIVDEVIGETIAEYIGGYKGRFEFVRFDKLKPGILSKLGPFMDDIIAGLIGGISANIYSRSYYNNKEKDY